MGEVGRFDHHVNEPPQGPLGGCKVDLNESDENAFMDRIRKF